MTARGAGPPAEGGGMTETWPPPDAPDDAVAELAAALRDAVTRPLPGDGPQLERQARWLISRRLAYPPSMLAAAVALARREQAFRVTCAEEDRDAALGRMRTAVQRITAATGNAASATDWARWRAEELTPAKRAIAEQAIAWVEQWLASAGQVVAELSEQDTL